MMITLPALTLLTVAATQSTESLLPPTPEGWRHERLEFPLGFAPEIELRGFEDLAFAPGMFEPQSASYFSYALALRLEGDVRVDEAMLVSFLETYYRGLCRAVGADRGLELDLTAIHARVARDGPLFRATVAMFDPFVTGERLDLELEVTSHCAPRATEVLGLASPLEREAPIWDELHAIAEAWREARPVPLFLNHVFAVVDQESFDAIESSSFLRETFAVSEARTTVRADLSYSGLYFYGERTYFEFLAPDPAAGLVEGTSGLAFGVEVEGALEALSRRLDESEVHTQLAPITRQLDAEQVPWFQILGVEMPPTRVSIFAMEYDPQFLASWHPKLAPAAPSITRAGVLERYAAVLDRSPLRASAPFADVSEVQLALDEAGRARLFTVCEAAGHEIEMGEREWTCHAPQFRLVVRDAVDADGVSGFELALRAPIEHEPIQLGRAVLSFRDRKATFVLRP